MILVKRWKETTATTKREDFSVDGENLEALAKSIIDQLGEKKDIIWAQVQVNARVTVLEEI